MNKEFNLFVGNVYDNEPEKAKAINEHCSKGDIIVYNDILYVYDYVIINFKLDKDGNELAVIDVYLKKLK